MVQEFKYLINKLLEEYKVESLASTRFRSKYEILSNICTGILSINTKEELYKFSLSIRTQKEDNLVLYSIKMGEYKKLGLRKASNKELNKVAIELNEIVNINEVYAKIIDIYNKVYKRSTINEKGSEFNNSEEIISLLKKYNSLDKDSIEALELNKQIFDIREKREEEVKEKYGINGVKILFEIESLENRIINAPILDKEKEYNAYELVKKINEILLAINEYHFRDESNTFFEGNTHYEYDNNLSKSENEFNFYKKYISYVIRYNNIIESVFHTKNYNLLNNGNDNNITTNDLLNYLTNYNVKGGYKLFMSKYSNSRIGNEIVSKKIYLENVEIINEAFLSLAANINAELGTDRVIIKNYQKTEKDLMNEIKSKYSELNNLEVKEEYHVHR